MKVKELQPSHLYCRRGTQSRPLPLSALWWFPLPPPILWATPFGVFTPPPPRSTGSCIWHLPSVTQSSTRWLCGDGRPRTDLGA